MILVTGATGFIGHHVVRNLLDKKLKLRILLLESERGSEKEFPDTEAVFGDLSNEAVLKNALSGVETVIHLASKNIDRDGSGFQKINVEGTQRLCSQAVEAGVECFIYLSTVGVYGHRKLRNADETTSVNPDTDFSRSKAEAEKIVLSHHHAGDFTGFVLRHRFVYGKGDLHVIPRMIRAAQKYPFLISKGRARLSMILVDDLAKIISHFVLDDAQPDALPVYHVTDGAPLRYRDLIHTLCYAYGFNPPGWNIPFNLLYYPIWLKEKLTGTDPETTKASLSSIRLKLVGLDNYFSNRKLMQTFPGLTLTPFESAFPDLKEYYSQFVDKS
ncbi:NAD-dependent epimerase/dehydratase family protein [candidate division KSB1 bacterium]|nr:NAD-dependent epimerase/dehydratase family protein [candidate division KSB1 bacterium]